MEFYCKTIAAISLCINIILIGAVVYLSMNGKNYTCVACDDNNLYLPNCDMARPYDLGLAKQLVDSYRVNQWAAINSFVQPFARAGGESTPDNIDARSAWFSLETLKMFIHTIETYTSANCKNNPGSNATNPPKPPLLGIRIYYGQYPSDHGQLSNYKPSSSSDEEGDFTASNQNSFQYAGMHTLLMIPTCDDASGNHVDFDPRDMNVSLCPIQMLTDFSFHSSLGDDILALGVESVGTTSPGNKRGGLAPPPFHCQDESSTENYQQIGATFMNLVDNPSSGITCPQARMPE